MQEKDKDNYAFIKEKIKEKPISKKRMLFYAGFCVAMAIVFGVVASLVFTIVQPKMEEQMYPQNNPTVSIPKDEPTEEIEESTETVASTENETETATEIPGDEGQGTDTESDDTYEITALEEYQLLQNQMYDVGREANKFIVTVTGVKSDIDWFNNAYESKGQASGIIVANNGQELLILTERKAISDARDIFVTFIDDTTVNAQVRKYDGNTGIVILSVPLTEIEETTMNAIKVATLGNSLTVKQGTVVLAVGSPLGTNYSILSGNITSTTNTISTIDANYNVFTTDIIASKAGSGAIINLNGEVVGLVMQDYSSVGDENTLTAVAISELKALIEMLSNGKDIPYIGLGMTTVTTAIAKEYDIPKGAYIKEIKWDSPAMLAGIQNGDVLTEVDGTTIYSVEHYENKLLSLKPQDVVEVIIYRQGNGEYKEIKCEVEVGILQ